MYLFLIHTCMKVIVFQGLPEQLTVHPDYAARQLVKACVFISFAGMPLTIVGGGAH